jgi:hypothetical protein
MTDYATAVQAVIDQTRRTDKEAFIRRKVNAAIQVIQSSGAFPQDLYEVSYSGAGLTADSYSQSLALPARTRQVGYVMDADRPDARIDIWPVAYILDNPQINDVGYQAGNALQLRLAEIPATIKLGAYQYLPALAADADTNWVLTDLFELVVDYTVAYVAAHTGDKDLAASIQNFAVMQMQAHVLDRIQQPFGA